MSRVLAFDQGTSSSRCVAFDADARPLASAQVEFRQIYPKPGWVEHDPEEIWRSIRQVARECLEDISDNIDAIGITNQRETVVVWDRNSGECVYNAIVWQDRRTAEHCARLRADGKEALVMEKTGLRLDPYFSATKIAWILDNVPGIRDRALAGELACGTIDSFLLWRMTGGRAHATDATNASRTLLFNIHSQEWDDELLTLFDVPRVLLPAVLDSAADFGSSIADEIGVSAPITGIAGDQQAALMGQAGFDEGMTKSTYGTGCFVIANTGDQFVPSRNRLLTTVASRIGGKVTYGLEGSVFVAGSAIQWLRDELQIISTAAETERIAEETGVVDEVHVVPAFTGLGAPHWDAGARGAIFGLTRGSHRNDLVTATLQAVAYQTHDLIKAMSDDGLMPSLIRVDGGMVGNNWFLQFLADVLGLPVERPVNVESTVLGAACFAGLHTGVFESTSRIASLWQRDRLFEPGMTQDRRDSLLDGWSRAVARVRSDS